MNLPQVRGVELDAQTRCGHYHGSTDIIAIKMKCCGEYYACKDCHIELAGHSIIGVADGRVGLRGDTLRGLWSGADDSGVYAVRELLSGVWGSVQSGVPKTLSFLF